MPKRVGTWPVWMTRLFRFKDHNIVVLVDHLDQSKHWWVAKRVREAFGDKHNSGRISYQEPQDRLVITLNGRRTLLISDRGLQRYLSRLGDPATEFKEFVDGVIAQLPSHRPTVPNCEVMPSLTVAKNDQVYIDIKTPGVVTEIKLPNRSVCVVYTPQEGVTGNARVTG